MIHGSSHCALCPSEIAFAVSCIMYNLLPGTTELNALANAPVQYPYTKNFWLQVCTERATRQKIVVCVSVCNDYHRHIA